LFNFISTPAIPSEGRATMGTAIYGAVGCLLLVFFTLAILPLIRKDLLEGVANEKKYRNYTSTLDENYKEEDGVTGFCTRCTHHGREASLKMYRNNNNGSLILLLCPSCGSAFQVNSGSRTL
jgi:Rieske Fe-S protein